MSLKLAMETIEGCVDFIVLRPHVTDQTGRTLLSHHKTKMENEAETTTIRLTSEIIRCIAKSLLASAEELERSLWHYSSGSSERPHSTPSEHDGCDALSL